MDRSRGNAALILRLQILRHLRDRQIHATWFEQAGPPGIEARRHPPLVASFLRSLA